MINLYNNLNPREKRLIKIILVIVFIAIVTFFTTNIISNLNNSEKRLQKAKYDYEYVLNKVQSIQQSIFLNTNDASELIELIKLDPYINNNTSSLLLSNEDGLIKISFHCEGLDNSLKISNDISNKLQRQAKDLNYIKRENYSITSITFYE